MLDKKKSAYAKRMQKVCEYIYAHLDENLSIEQLSQVANFSKFHFHRQFSQYLGISVSKFIHLIRLKRAAYQLVFDKQQLIIDIALDANFENPESFSRAFKNYFGQTPSQFRKNPNWNGWCAQFDSLKVKIGNIMNIDIVTFPTVKVAVLEHRGSPSLLDGSVEKFIAWRKESGLSPVATSRTLGIAYDDPNTTAEDEFRFDICGSIVEDVPENSHTVISKIIPGGRCATLRHQGAHKAIDAKVHYLYGEWLPVSGEELRDFPCYFEYINISADVADAELITDIYLPLKN